MKVKAVREHSNTYPPAGRKAKGTEYRVDDKTGRSLISAGLVAEVAGLA